jgi:hypothetical protein
VYKAIDLFHEYDATQTLDGSDVLPGFVLPIGQLFEQSLKLKRSE